MTQPQPPSGYSAAAVLIRFVVLLAIVVLGTLSAHALKEALNLQMMPETEQQMHRMIMGGLLLYIVLLAIPFVPGAEIGLAMLTAFGAAIVPLVYGATLLGMLLAFVIGSVLPSHTLARALSFIRLRKAADLIARAGPLPREEKLALIMEGAPPRTVALALRHRYVALAVMINIPGNVVIGGGGGIMMMAGLSRVFAPLPTFLALAVGISPIPIVVLLVGV